MTRTRLARGLCGAAIGFVQSGRAQSSFVRQERERHNTVADLAAAI